MKKIFFIVCLMATMDNVAQGEKSSNEAEHSVGINYGSLRVQTVSEDRVLRSAFGITYFYPLHQYVRVGASLLLADDDQSKSKVIVFDENYTWLTPMVEATTSWFFRYSASFGPSLIMSNSEWTFEDQVHSESRTQFGYVMAGRIDYSPHPICDVGLFLTYNQRITDDKSDWMWGVQGTFNISALAPAKKGKS
jgi:hypothetical protein